MQKQDMNMKKTKGFESNHCFVQVSDRGVSLSLELFVKIYLKRNKFYFMADYL